MSIPSAPAPDPAALPVIIIGGGGHAHVLVELLERLGRSILFITDRNERAHGQDLGPAKIRGGDELIFEFRPEQVRLVNAIGSVAQPFARREVYDRFRSKGYTFETLVHPAAVVAGSARLADGVQVMAGAVIQAGAAIGANTVINTRASVDHDCVIGPHVHVGPGVTLSGDVRIGDTTHVGTGSSVIQGVRVGREAMVGAAALVIREVPDGARVAGVPARPLGPGAANAAATAVPGGNISAGGHIDREPFTLLLSAAGRRVALLRLLCESAAELGLRPRTLGTDVSRASAAFHLADAAHIVPRYTEPGCLDVLLDLCRTASVKLIVPTIDPDLPFFAEHAGQFEAVGTRVLVSSPETVGLANDKRRTHAWLVAQGFPTVRQVDAVRLLAGEPGWSFPVFVKPRAGSSSIGARAVRSVEELRLAVGADDRYVAQEVAPGLEYTVDVYVDQTGRCRCAVPRLRLETRGGEVSKGMTVRCAPVEDVVRRIAEALPGAWGVLNIQVFYDAASGALHVSEINPRFGGGYPLTHRAGAPMCRWAIEEALGLLPTASNDAWAEGIVMLRYDEAVFVSAAQAGLFASGQATLKELTSAP